MNAIVQNMMGTEPVGARDDRLCVRTFDIFDTLIARRWQAPASIFTIVGAQAGIADFVSIRMEAEQQVSHRPYSLDDIYEAIGARLGLPAGEADRLKRLEFDAEIANIVPVAEMIAEVRDGDILVSDMYLTAGQIRALLDAAGFSKLCQIYVTNGGKAQGSAWTELLKQTRIDKHAGDNPHSDFNAPRMFGIPARHVTVSHANELELFLNKSGLNALPFLVREARLSTFDTHVTNRELQLVQIQYNFPLLFCATAFVVDAMETLGAKRVVMCSRDCHLWLDLLKKLDRTLGLGCDPGYFWISRLAAKTGSDGYLGYAREALQGSPLVVDMTGSGRSFFWLASKLGLPIDFCILHDRRSIDAFRTQGAIKALVSATDGEISCAHLEYANYALHQSIVDVMKVGERTWLPVLDDNRYDAFIEQAISVMNGAFRNILDLSSHYDLRADFTKLKTDRELRKAVSVKLLEGLANAPVLGNVFHKFHSSLNMITEQRLS